MVIEAMNWNRYVGARISNPVVTAYHGGPVPIRRFARKYSAMAGIFWFSEDKAAILAGERGASNVRYIMEARLTVNKTAGRDEYEKYSIGELAGLGYDSVKLDDVWIIFDSKQIKVVRAEKVA
jgi:hypothetical protein